MKVLCWLILTVQIALAQSFPAGPHVTIQLSAAGKFVVQLRGKKWPGPTPSGATYRLLRDSYGGGQVSIQRISDLSGLQPARGPGRATQGLVTSRSENRACAWVSDSPQGGCLVLTDVSRGEWSGPSNLMISPAQTPVLASIWMSPADLKTLTQTVYRAMDAQHDLPRHQ